MILILGLLIKFGKVLPGLHNIWIDFGIGPTTLTDIGANYTYTPTPNAPMFFWWIITGIGVFSSIALLFRGISLGRKVFEKKVIRSEVIFSCVFSIIYLAPFLVAGVYDRYLLPLFPIVIVFLASYEINPLPNKISKYAAFVFLGLISWFSVCGTHDYLSWNRVRWDAINRLLDAGVPTNKIQGGAEFVTWYHFSEAKKRWWEDVTPVYTLVFSADTGNPIHEKLSYSRWLPGEGVMYVTYCASLEEEIE
ncbi:hypothetical protein GCM10009430_40130 [Aquimarina litoralis]|uniref:Glycosyltransferase RgtA/B/C/D-like domain-containing protein n=1 Tax=Aquimarina litoralis TaxID=584605 RepID=A0ABN1J5U6_9FLAO